MHISTPSQLPYNEKNDFARILQEYFNIGFNCSAVVATPIPQPSLYKEYGYSPNKIVATDGFMRGVYYNISNEDMLEFTCKPHHEAGSRKIERSFMIQRG